MFNHSIDHFMKHVLVNVVQLYSNAYNLVQR